MNRDLPAAPYISVIVCTRDRAERLRRMLESACALEVPPGLAWELVVVDNGSSDATVAVARSFSTRLPIRCVAEPRPGLSRARNRGVEEARGAWICWTDDDVLLDPGWLAAYAAAFARHPDAALFGGRILPRLDPPAAPWFARYMDRWPLAPVIGWRDFGDEELPFHGPSHRLPWGANFAVRADAQQRHLYNPELVGSGEETDLAYRILKEGLTGWWVPASIVTHLIPPERQTRHYLVEYYRLRGGEAAYLHRARPGANLHGTPTWADCTLPGLHARAAACLLVSWAARITGLTPLGLRFLARHGYARGLIDAARKG